MRRILGALSVFATIEAFAILISLGFSTQAANTQNQSGSFGTITIKDTEGTPKFVIMDRDLGAVKAGTDDSAYGQIYQWGNNFGFSPLGNNKTSTGITINYEDNEYGPKNPYNFDKIRLNAISQWEAQATNNLWGGSGDYVYDSVKDLRLKQGPCPDGFHVPSNRERSDLLSLWRNINRNGRTNRDNSLLEKMRVDLKIPFTPIFEIKNQTGTYKNIDENGNLITQYWTSTPYKYQDNAYSFRFSTNSNSFRNVYQYTSRSTVGPIRCFKNTPVSYTISFETNGGSKVEPVRLDPGYVPQKPEDPTKSGFDFGGWYLDQEFKTKFDFYEKEYNNFNATGDLVLYAKWDKKLASYITHKLDVTTYTTSDDSFAGYRVKPMGTITITNPETNESITILDRNLGANSISTGFSDDSAVFQWGNNYGFNRYILSNPNFNYGYISIVESGAKFENYGPGNRYNSNTFRHLPNETQNILHGDYWENSKTYPNLWGGGNDSLENGRGGTGNGAERQGPCPDGFHVPSAGEWNYLLDFWGDLNPGAVDTWDDFFNRITDHNSFEKFQNELLIPKVDKVYWETKGFTSSAYGAYWTSSTNRYGTGRSDIEVEYSPSFSPSDRSWLGVNDLFHYRDTNVHMDGDDHITGNPIRCFADVKRTPLVTVKFITNAYKWSDTYHYDDTQITKQKVQLGWYAYEPEEPQKSGYSFVGWYKDKELTIPFDFKKEPITTPISLYAKWDQNVNADFGIISLKGKQGTSYEGKEIVMLDRDLGASDIGGGDGYLFQRGNNYGFGSNPYGGEKESNNLVEYNGYRPGNWYSSNTKIKDHSDYWSGDEHYNNLRGGEYDGKDNQRGSNNLGEIRQGPCPNGFHVPSIGEWNNLLKMWYENEGLEYNTNKGGILIKGNSNFDSEKFQNYFKIPGQHTYWSSSPYNEREGENDYMQRTAMPLFARVFTVRPVDASRYNERTALNNIRCFKDSTTHYKVSFNTNGGTPINSIILDEDGRSNSFYNMEGPKKEGYDFIGWYLSPDSRSDDSFKYEGQPIYEDLILYAKWGLKSINGDITIKDPNSNNKIVIQDKNVGARISDISLNTTKNFRQYGSLYQRGNSNTNYRDWRNRSSEFKYSLRGGTTDNIQIQEDDGLYQLFQSKRGVCPSGYHVPTIEEWKLLVTYLNGNSSLDNQNSLYQLMTDLRLPTYIGKLINGNIQTGNNSSIGGDGNCYWASSYNENQQGKAYAFCTDESDSYFRGLRTHHVTVEYQTLSVDVGLPVRCFKNIKYDFSEIEDNEEASIPQNITINFETNGGNKISAMKVSTSQEVTLPTPMKKDFTFSAWYLDKKFKNKFTSIQSISGDITLYARWIEQAHVSYLKDPEYKNNGEDINVITITSKDGEHSISLMDRNLGATSNDSSNSSSYGCFYQRGNNHCFMSPLTKTGHIFSKYNSYGPGNWFENDNFFIPMDTEHPLKDGWGEVIVGYGAGFYKDSDYRENEGQYPNLWGGQGDLDSKRSLTKDDGNERTERQGPCPEGYHIPSNGERYWVTEIGGEGTYMIEYLKLPVAISDKNNSSAGILSPGYYWTSSPHRMSTYNPVNIGSYGRNISHNRINLWLGLNTDAANIRCFRNEVLTGELINEDDTSNDSNNIKNSVTYSIKYYRETLTGDYELYKTETLKAESGSQVTPPVKSFSGYNTPSQKTIVVSGDGSSVAEYKYERIKYKVTVEKGTGVSAVKGNGEYKYGQNVSIRAIPLPGYKITGFDGDVKTGSFSMPAKDVTIIVKAEKDDTKYKISYDYNGGKLESGKVNPATYTTNSQSFNLNLPVKDGFIFAGWQESINGKLVGIKSYLSIPKGSSGNRSYKAIWKKEGEVGEVIYNQQEDLDGKYNSVEVVLVDNNGGGGNSGGGNGNSITPKKYEGFITPTHFSKQTASSNVNQGPAGEVLNLSDGVAVIIYKYKRDSFTLTIDTDEGIDSVEGAGTYKYQQPVSIRVTPKSGYTFAGFEGEINVSDFEMPAKNLVIKATSTKN